MAHNYTHVINHGTPAGDWTIAVSPTTHYGYFEYNGENKNNIEIHIEGGLWFSGQNLVDYDGVFELPLIVIRSLVQLGYTVDKEFYPEPQPC
jgi:hypothetical protein